MKSTEKKASRIIEFSKSTEHMINKENSLVFPQTSNESLEN